MSARGGRRILRDLAPFLCIATLFLLPLRYKGLERTINLRSLPTSLIGRHLHWSVLVFNAHLLSLSRIIVPTPNFNAPMPAGMPPGQRHKTCGIPAPTVPNASRLGVCMTLLPVLLVRRSSRTCSTPCRTFLADMQHPLSDVPRGHAAWPVCIVSRQRNLDKVEQDVGQQVGKRTTWTPSWIKIASRLYHMYDLWRVVRTKPQVLK